MHKIIIFVISFFCLFFSTTPTFADDRIATEYICSQVGNRDDEAFTKCATCQAENGIWTALGCVPTTIDGIVESGLRLGLGLAGGFALLFIIFGSFTISSSTGDPQRLQTGQQMITSAVVGILLIVFSVIIMNIIGVQILAIPGF